MKILVNFSLENDYFFIYVVLTIHKDSFQEVSFVVFNNVPPFWFSKWGEHILHTLITYSYFNILCFYLDIFIAKKPYLLLLSR